MLFGIIWMLTRFVPRDFLEDLIMSELFIPSEILNPEPVTYECKWSGEWSPIPGCAIETDVDYKGRNLNSNTARDADRQPDAHTCQAFCRASGNRGAIRCT